MEITRTATVTCGPTLTAEVKILREVNAMYFEVEVIAGTGGWDEPGKIFDVRKTITELHTEPMVEVPAPAPAAVEPLDLTGPVTGDEYIAILLQRQAAYIARNSPNGTTCPPLLEWFIRADDEDFVQIPEPAPAPKQKTTPRVYRSAASLREERDRVQAQIDNFGDSSAPDRASANLSPNARSKAARNAGRQRFERMDRDLERFTALVKRRDMLNGRVATAEDREHRVDAPSQLG